MQGKTVWLFGLSGAGKTTLGKQLADKLGWKFIDADTARKELNVPPNFSREGREFFQRTLRDYCLDCLEETNVVVASITPYRSMRVCNHWTFKNYFEVFLNCSLDTLILRDPKGLYKKAICKEISSFTGISDPFELPACCTPKPAHPIENMPSLVLHTDTRSETECFELLLQKVRTWIDEDVI
jgi:adenylylsulfate kinase